MEGKDCVTEAPGKYARRKKAVISILQVLAENELTASEIQSVMFDVNEAIDLRPLTLEFVNQYNEDAERFKSLF